MTMTVTANAAAAMREDDLATRLKGATMQLHRQAETRPLQRAIGRGTLPREAFAVYLAQLLHVHRALEAALRTQQVDTPAIRVVFRETQQREDDLLADLAHFSASNECAAALEATREAVQRIERDARERPAALLGHLYVLEGSTNGGRFLARVIRKAYDLPDDRGVRYFDPYGDDQPAQWQAFRAAMNAAAFDGHDEAALFDAANAMFSAITAISDAVYERHVGVETADRSSDA